MIPARGRLVECSGFTDRYIINKHVVSLQHMFENIHKYTEYIWNMWNANIGYYTKKNLPGCYLGDLTTGNIIMLFYLLKWWTKLCCSICWYHTPDILLWKYEFLCVSYCWKRKHNLFCQCFQSLQYNEICPGWNVNTIIITALRMVM